MLGGVQLHEKESIRDYSGRFIYNAEDLENEREKRKLRALADRNARLEKTDECWEECKCKKKS